MNKILSSGLVLGAMMSLVGCGGGSDPKEEVAATGTAYYIDSAVSGVNYKCGSQEGITGADGEFTFEVGSSCTFYLGDIELRGVDAGLLVDGESVYETDVEIARILQSLDSDGNPDNGITIEAATVQALADEGITSLPTTDTEMDEMLAVIAANGGTEVSEEDAAAHMLTTLLGGKIFYVVDEADDGSKQVTKLTFNEDLTSIEAISPEMTENWGITIEGSRLTFNEDTDGSYTIITVDQANDYIMFTDYYSDGSLDGMGHRLYRDKADAEAYFDSLKNPDLVALLSGKTFYNSKGGEDDYITSLVFNEDASSMIATVLDGPESGKTTTNTISVEGNRVIFNGSDGFLTFMERTNEYLLFDETRFYFEQAKADAYFATLGGGSSTSDLTELIVGKTLYMHWTDGTETWINALTFQADGNISEIDDGQTRLTPYRIEGNIIYTTEEDNGVMGEMAHPVVEITSTYIKINDNNFDANGNAVYTFFYFTQADAEASTPMEDNMEDNSFEAPTEFTQEVVSQSVWYVVEYEDTVAYCNGIFAYDGNNNLTVAWNDPGDSGSVTLPYSITDGKVVTSHDGKTETETLSVYADDGITTSKAVVYDDGSTPPPAGNKKWFRTQASAEAFLSTYTNPEASSCF